MYKRKNTQRISIILSMILCLSMFSPIFSYGGNAKKEQDIYSGKICLEERDMDALSFEKDISFPKDEKLSNGNTKKFSYFIYFMDKPNGEKIRSNVVSGKFFAEYLLKYTSISVLGEDGMMPLIKESYDKLGSCNYICLKEYSGEFEKDGKLWVLEPGTDFKPTGKNYIFEFDDSDFLHYRVIFNREGKHQKQGWSGWEVFDIRELDNDRTISMPNYDWQFKNGEENTKKGQVEYPPKDGYDFVGWNTGINEETGEATGKWITEDTKYWEAGIKKQEEGLWVFPIYKKSTPKTTQDPQNSVEKGDATKDLTDISGNHFIFSENVYNKARLDKKARPYQLSVTAKPGRRMLIEWTDCTKLGADIDGYIITRKVGTSKTFVEYTKVSKNVNYYKDILTKKNMPYYYMVFGYKKDSNGNITISENSMSATGQRLDSKRKMVTPNINRKFHRTKGGENVQLRVNYRIKRGVIPTSEWTRWRSHNNNIATINQNGLVTPKRPGTALISARTPNGKDVRCSLNIGKDGAIEIKKIEHKYFEKLVYFCNGRVANGVEPEDYSYLYNTEYINDGGITYFHHLYALWLTVRRNIETIERYFEK